MLIFIVYVCFFSLILFVKKRKKNISKDELSDYPAWFQFIYIIILQLSLNYIVLPISLFFFTLVYMNKLNIWYQPERILSASLVSVIVPYLLIIFITIFDKEFFESFSSLVSILKPFEKAYALSLFMVLVFSAHNSKVENVFGDLIYHKNYNFTTFGVIMLVGIIIFTNLRMTYSYFESKDKKTKKLKSQQNIEYILDSLTGLSNGLSEFIEQNKLHSDNVDDKRRNWLKNFLKNFIN